MNLVNYFPWQHAFEYCRGCTIVRPLPGWKRGLVQSAYQGGCRVCGLSVVVLLYISDVQLLGS